MRWKLKMANAEILEVELLQIDGDRFEFLVGKEKISLSRPKVFPYSIEVNGLRLSCEAWSKTSWRASHDDRCFSVEPQSLGSNTKADFGEIRTQMPGRVLKVLVSPGQRVEARQTLVILEAMKMENEIRAEAAAIVESIEVQAGQSLESGSLLLKLTAA